MTIQYVLDYVKLSENNSPETMQKLREIFPEIRHHELFEKSYAKKEDAYVSDL